MDDSRRCRGGGTHDDEEERVHDAEPAGPTQRAPLTHKEGLPEGRVHDAEPARPSRSAPPNHKEGLPTLRIREAVLREIISSGFSEPHKVAPDALTLSSALIRAFTAEAAHRSARCALARSPASQKFDARHMYILPSPTAHNYPRPAGKPSRVVRPRCCRNTWSVSYHSFCWTSAHEWDTQRNASSLYDCLRPWLRGCTSFSCSAPKPLHERAAAARTGTGVVASGERRTEIRKRESNRISRARGKRRLDATQHDKRARASFQMRQDNMQPHKEGR